MPTLREILTAVGLLEPDAVDGMCEVGRILEPALAAGLGTSSGRAWLPPGVMAPPLGASARTVLLGSDICYSPWYKPFRPGRSPGA
jgi:hypothetical protein